MRPCDHCGRAVPLSSTPVLDGCAAVLCGECLNKRLSYELIREHYARYVAAVTGFYERFEHEATYVSILEFARTIQIQLDLIVCGFVTMNEPALADADATLATNAYAMRDFVIPALTVAAYSPLPQDNVPIGRITEVVAEGFDAVDTAIQQYGQLPSWKRHLKGLGQQSRRFHR